MGGQFRWLMGLLVLMVSVSARADGPGDACRSTTDFSFLDPSEEYESDYRTKTSTHNVPKDRCRTRTPFSCVPAAIKADDRPRLCHRVRKTNLFAVCNTSARLFDSAGQDMGQLNFNRPVSDVANSLGVMINLGSRKHVFPNNCANDPAFGGRAVLTWRTPVVGGTDRTGWVCLKDFCAGEAANIDNWLYEDLPPNPNTNDNDYRQFKLRRVPQENVDSFRDALGQPYRRSLKDCVAGSTGGGVAAVDYLNNHDTIGISYNIPTRKMGSTIEFFNMKPGDNQPWVFYKPKKWIVNGKRVKLRNAFVSWVNCHTGEKKPLEFWYGAVLDSNGQKRFGWIARPHIGTKIP